MTEKAKMAVPECATGGREIRNALRMSGWVLAWALSWAGASQAIQREWLAEGGWSYLAVGLSTGVGLAMIGGFRKFLREADELQRRIQLEALAVSLGAALVGSSTYRLLERAGVTASPDVSNIVLLISVVYAGAVLLGQWRYA